MICVEIMKCDHVCVKSEKVDETDISTHGIVIRGKDGHDGTNGRDGQDGRDGRDGKRGEPFKYEDFTPEQLESLKVKGDKGDKGDKGEPFKYSDFTPQQLESLKVKGDKGDQGVRGLQGEKGEPFRYSDFTPAQLEALRGQKGDKGAQGIQGIQGEKGDKGDKGDKGEDGKITDAQIEIVIDRVKDGLVIPTKTSELTNDSNYVSDGAYVHTDNNYTSVEKNKLSGLENYDDTDIRQRINDVNESIGSKSLSDFTDDLGSNPTHTHSQYMTESDVSDLIDAKLGAIENGYY